MEHLKTYELFTFNKKKLKVSDDILNDTRDILLELETLGYKFTSNKKNDKQTLDDVRFYWGSKPIYRKNKKDEFITINIYKESNIDRANIDRANIDRDADKVNMISENDLEVLNDVLLRLCDYSKMNEVNIKIDLEVEYEDEDGGLVGDLFIMNNPSDDKVMSQLRDAANNDVKCDNIDIKIFY